MTLLTAEQNVSLRKLRTYAASLGAHGEIVRSLSQLMKALSPSDQAHDRDLQGYRSIAIVDGSFRVSKQEFIDIQNLAPIVQIDPRPSFLERGSDCGQRDVYLQCTLNRLLDSTTIRNCLAHVLHHPRGLPVESLLLWGHARVDWDSESADDLVAVGRAFLEKFQLRGPWRRAMESFCHFSEVGMPKLGLTPLTVSFASDGITLAIMASVQLGERSGVESSSGAVAAELRLHGIPVSIVRNPGERVMELGSIFAPYDEALDRDQVVIMINGQRLARSGLKEAS